MDIAAARRRLEEERSRLLDVQQAAMGLHPPAEHPQQLVRTDQLPAEQATETLERELDETVVHRVGAELAEVEAALAKLDGGTYGRCEICGNEIAEARLEAIPAARFCVDDQAKAERDPRYRRSA